MTQFLHTRLVSEAEYRKAKAAAGAVYFIKDDATDCIKIGHSRDPIARLASLQVSTPTKLRFVGLVAGSREVEQRCHEVHREGHVRGEWFRDRGVITAWLHGMTQGEPIGRHVWRLLHGTAEVFQEGGWNHVFWRPTGIEVRA